MSNALQPGLELDTQIATHVLGWKKNGGPPRFSTDMAAAWELAEQLKRRWHGFFSLDSYPDGRWVCANNDAYSRTHTPTIEGIANTPQMAICLAALKTAETEAANA